MTARPVAGGGRAVDIEPQRLPRWFDNFARRNGGIAHTTVTAADVTVHANDGTTASATPPVGQLKHTGTFRGLAVDELVAVAGAARRIGLVLFRLGAHSIGIAEGGQVVVSRTTRHNVPGRHSAGGWSQQRFARRRANQARQAIDRAAVDVAEVLGGEIASLDAVVLGGDRAALDELRVDRRVTAVFAKAADRVLDVAEPRRSVLDEAARRARAVTIVLHDPG